MYCAYVRSISLYVLCTPSKRSLTKKNPSPPVTHGMQLDVLMIGGDHHMLTYVIIVTCMHLRTSEWWPPRIAMHAVIVTEFMSKI